MFFIIRELKTSSSDLCTNDKLFGVAIDTKVLHEGSFIAGRTHRVVHSTVFQGSLIESRTGRDMTLRARTTRARGFAIKTNRT